MPDLQHTSAALMAFVNALAARGGAEHRARTLRALVEKLTVDEARAISARVKPGGAWRRLVEEQLTASAAHELLERIAQRAVGSTSSVRMTIIPEQRGTARRGTENRSVFSRGLGVPVGGAAESVDDEGHIQLPPPLNIPVPPPAKIEATSAQQRAGLVCLHFFDLAGTFDNYIQLRDDVLKRVVRGLNAFRGDLQDKKTKSLAKQMGLSFGTTFSRKMPSKAQVAALLPLDYPFYVIDPLSSSTETEQMKLVYRLMLMHGVSSKGHDWFKDAKASFATPDAGGFAIPTGSKGTAKVSFILSSALTFAKMEAWGVANDIVHEFGHNNNAPWNPHPKDRSLMSNTPKNTRFNFELMHFNRSDAKTVFDNIHRLWTIQQHM